MHGNHYLDNQREEWQTILIAEFTAKLGNESINYVQQYPAWINKFATSPIDPQVIYEQLKTIRCETLCYDPEEVSTEDIQIFVNQIIELAEFIDKNELKNLYELPFNPHSATIPWGPVHLDIHDENILFENGKISSLLDWEELSLGSLLLDLAFVILNWSTRNGHWDMHLGELAIKAYESRRLLNKKERTLLWSYVLIGGMFYVYYMISRFYEYEINAKYIPRYLIGIYELYQLGPNCFDGFFKKIDE